jgi:hypothetical protein
MRRLPATLLLASGTLCAGEAYPPARFTDPDRVRTLEAALPEIDGIFRGYAEERKIPGMVWAPRARRDVRGA